MSSAGGEKRSGHLKNHSCRDKRSTSGPLYAKDTDYAASNYPAHEARVGKVISVGVHIIYIYILYIYYVCEQKKKNSNSTLAINSPFQIFAVGLLVEFID